MSGILTAALVVGGIGALCALMLIAASKFFAVKENETVGKIRECLPGANCGACGYAGCDGYAKALAEEEGIKTNLCIPGADAVAKQIADILGVEAEDVVEQVAVIHCYGDCEHTKKKMEYEGIDSCAAAKTLYGGTGLCNYGCIGLGDCVSVCPQDAICIENGMAHIDTRLCIGCGLCAKTCPRNIIELVPQGPKNRKVVVLCNNKDKGALATKECKVSCIGCGKCVKVCEKFEAITLGTNLAHIDPDKCKMCRKCEEACPRGAIKAFNFPPRKPKVEAPSDASVAENKVDTPKVNETSV